MSAPFSRRAALAGALAAVPALAGAAAFSTPPAASPGPAIADPIFAAIERHRAAFDAFGDACRRTDHVAAEEEGRVVTDEDEAAWRLTCDAEDEALDFLLATVPQSVAGARAAITHLIQYDEGCVEEASSRFLPALLASPALAV